ncbi:MAG: four helix bundle protein [Gemmatimonadota bacterium]
MPSAVNWLPARSSLMLLSGMARAQRFEDLFAWQRARDLGKLVGQLCQRPGLARDFQLRDQISSAARSTKDNIAEGFKRGGHKEFRRFLLIASASCAEVRSHLYTAKDAGYLSSGEAARLAKLAIDVEGLIDRLRAAIPH